MTTKKKLSFLIAYSLVFLPIAGFLAGGMYNFLSYIVLFSVVPFMDYWIKDTGNPSPSEEAKLLQDRYFKLITLFYVPVQAGLLIFSVYIITHYDLLWYEWLGFTLSVGLVTGGVGINLSHELMHKNTPLQQFLSKALLSMVCYGHFIIEHVRGHHVRVATPEDAASAQLGDSLYRYLPKTIIGSFKSALHLEQRRLQQKGYSTTSFHNQFWWIFTAPLLIAAGCFWYGGTAALAFFLLQSALAIFLLETINYVEHYGLQRKKLANGRYEKVSPMHSWNANHWLSNMLLFHLQRHSDHHAHGARPYQILRHCEESPQLPSGYLGMIILAVIPPLWHAVMDKRALAFRETTFATDTGQLTV
ncbi:alkane 1-monooxygenase [Legionella spiritensis]|uniref:alkane 1-monooxygenase n=1 Tax=Legionella spiritensis TaxID=452 RepID=UPI000F6C929F|nr:alkane 1-monooxygenase [Legionella spiritensis]VEG91582.1 alkane monooxygenase [Legionella spiritensis]